MEKYLLLALAAIIGTAGQIMLKLGVNQIKPKIGSLHSLKDVIQSALTFLGSHWIFSAAILYALGAFLWLFVLLKFELTYAFPLMTIIYVLILIFSWLFLKEDINTLRIMGTLIIILGIILVAKSQ